MEVVDNIKNRCTEIISHPIEETINKPNWGELNFEEARSSFEIIYSIATDLLSYSIEKLPIDVLRNIDTTCQEASNVMLSVRQFTLTSSQNPAQVKAELVNRAHSTAYQLYAHCHQHISYLALKNDRVAQHIEKLAEANNNAANVLKAIEAQEVEVARIVSNARTVAAGIGIEKHAAEYDLEVINQKSVAKGWLIMTVIFAATTLIVAACFFFFSNVPANGIELIHKTTSKFFILGTLLFATVWSGRLYRAALHLKISYRQKDLALKTFRTFVDAASDTETKSAVLLEVTKTIFSSTNTGYVEEISKTSDSGVKIVEVVRNSAQTASALK